MDAPVSAPANNKSADTVAGLYFCLGDVAFRQAAGDVGLEQRRGGLLGGLSVQQLGGYPHRPGNDKRWDLHTDTLNDTLSQSAAISSLQLLQRGPGQIAPSAREAKASLNTGRRKVFGKYKQLQGNTWKRASSSAAC